MSVRQVLSAYSVSFADVSVLCNACRQETLVNHTVIGELIVCMMRQVLPPGQVLSHVYLLHAVCSIDFFRETEPELQHPSASGLSPAAIWLYRVLNVPLNILNAFWFYKMLTGALKVLRMSADAHEAGAQATAAHKVQ